MNISTLKQVQVDRKWSEMGIFVEKNMNRIGYLRKSKWNIEKQTIPKDHDHHCNHSWSWYNLLQKSFSSCLFKNQYIYFWINNSKMIKTPNKEILEILIKQVSSKEQQKQFAEKQYFVSMYLLKFKILG